MGPRHECPNNGQSSGTCFSMLIRLELAQPGNQILGGNHQLYNGSPSGGHGKQCHAATWTKLCLSPEPAVGFTDAGVARQAGLWPGLPIARDARIHQLWLEVLQNRGLAQSARLCGIWGV